MSDSPSGSSSTASDSPSTRQYFFGYALVLVATVSMWFGQIYPIFHSLQQLGLVLWCGLALTAVLSVIGGLSVAIAYFLGMSAHVPDLFRERSLSQQLAQFRQLSTGKKALYLLALTCVAMDFIMYSASQIFNGSFLTSSLAWFTGPSVALLSTIGRLEATLRHFDTRCPDQSRRPTFNTNWLGSWFYLAGYGFGFAVTVVKEFASAALSSVAIFFTLQALGISLHSMLVIAGICFAPAFITRVLFSLRPTANYFKHGFAETGNWLGAHYLNCEAHDNIAYYQSLINHQVSADTKQRFQASKPLMLALIVLRCLAGGAGHMFNLAMLAYVMQIVGLSVPVWWPVLTIAVGCAAMLHFFGLSAGFLETGFARSLEVSAEFISQLRGVDDSQKQSSLLHASRMSNSTHNSPAGDRPKSIATGHHAASLLPPHPLQPPPTELGKYDSSLIL